MRALVPSMRVTPYEPLQQTNQKPTPTFGTAMYGALPKEPKPKQVEWIPILFGAVVFLLSCLKLGGIIHPSRHAEPTPIVAS